MSDVGNSPAGCRTPESMQNRWRKIGQAYLSDVARLGIAAEIGVFRADDGAAGSFTIDRDGRSKIWSPKHDRYTIKWLTSNISGDHPELRQLGEDAQVSLTSSLPDSKSRRDRQPGELKVTDSLFLNGWLEVDYIHYDPSFYIDTYGVGVVTALTIIANGERFPIWE